MMNNLPVKKKVSFIEKVKSFVLNLFNIKKDNIIEEDKQIPIIKEIKTNNFVETIKAEVNNDFIIEREKDKEREEFLNKIEENPNLLYELSEEKLIKLEKYYDELIEKETLKLEKLKKAN